MLIYPPCLSLNTTGSEESNVVDDGDDVLEATNAHKDAHEATIEMTVTSQPAAVSMATNQATKMPPTAPAPPVTKIALDHFDTCNTSIVAYYKEDDLSYAKAAVHGNEVIPEGTYKFIPYCDS